MLSIGHQCLRQKNKDEWSTRQQNPIKKNSIKEE